MIACMWRSEDYLGGQFSPYPWECQDSSLEEKLLSAKQAPLCPETLVLVFVAARHRGEATQMDIHTVVSSLLSIAGTETW